MNLPADFIDYTRSLFGEERWQRYLSAFSESAPVSIRLNPFKPLTSGLSPLTSFSVPWCRNAYYLSERPNFTMDPLLHAGAYYVQEASSMFLDYVIANLSPLTSHLSPLYLDLCAAPGGKSTLLRAAMPDDAVLYSNEPDRRRANILMENMQKQGHPRVIVTNNYPRDYQKSGLSFDFILADVPCSGEGMFRKDEGTIAEWSLQNVMKCQALQRSIIEDIWPCLNDGGIMVYSTCTFNTREDEENVRWIMETLGAEIIPIETRAEWGITGSLLEGFDAPVYRFIPGITCGEGLFMAILRKRGERSKVEGQRSKVEGQRLNVLHDGMKIEPMVKGRKVIPAHAEALSIATAEEKYPRSELTKDDALRYLHHEALVLPPDTPRGYVIVTYESLPLGFVNNLGTRANNLYPKEWKIRRDIQ